MEAKEIHIGNIPNESNLKFRYKASLKIGRKLPKISTQFIFISIIWSIFFLEIASLLSGGWAIERHATWETYTALTLISIAGTADIISMILVLRKKHSFYWFGLIASAAFIINSAILGLWLALAESIIMGIARSFQYKEWKYSDKLNGDNGTMYLKISALKSKTPATMRKPNDPSNNSILRK